MVTTWSTKASVSAAIRNATTPPQSWPTKIHLRLIFETGDKDYYWLNFVTAVGILQQVETFDNGSFILQIDAWNVSTVQG